MATVYLIHFDKKLAHAQHYIGLAADLDAPLAQIVAAGVTRFEATLPEYLRQGVDSEAVEPVPNLAISADRQREICLNCPLADCVGVGNDQCPLRVEARRQWRQHRGR